MKYEKGKEFYSGKVKTLYETQDPDLLITEFRDDTTAFDGVKHEKLTDKGAVNNKLSTFIMEVLAKEGVPTHLVEKLSANEVLVKKLKMVPLECVVRNIAAGSLCRRLGVQAGMKLSPPLFELFLKNDELHDPMVNRHHALAFGWATEEQMDQMRELTLKINKILSDLLAKGNMVLVDAKFEFGIDSKGVMTLGDEISPDSCRIWDAKSHEPLDKDRFRKDMGGVIEAYKQIAERLGL